MFNAKNIEFVDIADVKDLGFIPVFKITDLPAAEWNERAQAQNIKMFVGIFKRQPKDYSEVQAWIYSRNEENHSAGNTMAFA